MNQDPQIAPMNTDFELPQSGKSEVLCVFCASLRPFHLRQSAKSADEFP